MFSWSCCVDVLLTVRTIFQDKHMLILTHSHVNTHSCDVSYLQSLSVSVSEFKKAEPKPESKPQSNPVSKPVPKPHKAQERVSTNPVAPACSRSVASLPHCCLRLTTQQPCSMMAAIPHLLEGKVTALLLSIAFSGSVLCFFCMYLATVILNF